MSDDQFFIPVSAMEMPRFAGMPSFMRLPHLEMGSPRIDEVETVSYTHLTLPTTPYV